MGIKLVVEVLDHYHGPDHKFRWLVAFAEKANDRTRSGWPGRTVMMHRTGKSGARISAVASELVADGVLKREGGGGRGRGNARFVLLPLISQGSPAANPMEPQQGSPAANPQGSPAANPIQVTHSSSITLIQPSAPPGGAASAPTAQTILASFIDWDRANGGTLTRRTIGQLAKHIGALLAEGIDDRHIRNGLADWRAKEMHPATLDSFVNAAMNGHTPGRHRRMSTTDERVAAAQALKARTPEGIT